VGVAKLCVLCLHLKNNERTLTGADVDLLSVAVELARINPEYAWLFPSWVKKEIRMIKHKGYLAGVLSGIRDDYIHS
jgi:hypothetical protein